MIEIIREESLDREQERRELPKNIKQIGSPDIGDRIYIENKIYEYLHPYDSIKEKIVYVLLGKVETAAGQRCVFVEGAICLEEILFEGQTPIWDDDSWAYIYKKLKHAYDDMVIVGWALDLRGQFPDLTIDIEKLHRSYFGGEHQILYLLDSLEKEDAFFSLKNGYLKRRDGYYIYYDKAVSGRFSAGKKAQTQEEEMEQVQEDGKEEGEQIFWKQRMEKEWGKRAKKNGTQKSPSRQFYRQIKQEQKYVPSYGFSVLLLLVVCGLGYAAFKNYEKMSVMETALIQMNQIQTSGEKESDKVKVENVDGNLFAQENSDSVSVDGETAMAGNEIPEETAEETMSQGTDNAQQDVSLGADNTQQTDASAGADNTQQTDASAGADNTQQIDASAGADNTQQADASAGADNTQQAAAVPGTDNVQQIAGNVSGNGNVQQAAGTSQETQTAETMSESGKYLAQGYYIVQKGDNLAGISRKIYQTTAMMDKLCEANDIDNPDAIFEGQYLTLPN